jgi:hypothetical protein
MNHVERTIGRLETELKTNEEYKAKVIREIETRGQEEFRDIRISVFFLPGSLFVHFERYDFYIFSTLNETTYSCCKSIVHNSN